jgi:hypothetical protein
MPKDQFAKKRQLAALATLLGLMQAASKLSGELEELAKDIGGSVDEIAEVAGVPFFDVHNSYREMLTKKARKKKGR